MTAVDLAIRIARVDLYLLSAPIERPVTTSFAAMKARPALIVRVEDADGAAGWGEIWCNHPPFAGAYRLSLAAEILSPRILGQAFATPLEATSALEEAGRVLAIQCGEPGPYAQAIAGFDAALWDLAARRAGRRLCDLLRHTFNDDERPAAGQVPVYGSGINPEGCGEAIARARSSGHRAFKVKVGFGREKDLAAAKGASETLMPSEALMFDANQAWDLPEATEMARDLAHVASPAWLEEPLPADAAPRDWRALKEASAIPLAGGENILGEAAFEAAFGVGALGIIQPDVAKWGGVTRCFEVGRRARAAGRRYCPHFLGGAIGLAASAHLLAAVGGDGLLEVDANPNALRTDLAAGAFIIVDGRLTLPDAPGIGLTPDLVCLERHTIEKREITRNAS